jgi:ABC-type phosphate transport system substrate-binding protein
MSRRFSACVVLALLVCSGAAGARNYTGSDSLAVFTQTLVAQCGAVNGGTSYPALAGNAQFQYLSGGSGQGGADLRAGEQDIAPQSRPLNAAEACEVLIEGNPSSGPGNLGNDEAAAVNNPPGSGAEGLAVAVDGLSIALNPNTGARCDTTPADAFAAPLANTPAKTFVITNFTSNVPDNAPNITTFRDVPLPAPGGVLEGSPTPGTLVYRFTDFKDVLRILFAGADKSRPLATGPGGGGGNTQSTANRLSRCSSDIRRSLVSQWDNIVEGNPASCTGTSCGTLRRLFRRGDESGTTDIFLAILGLASAANTPFCNGTERDDQDPIRRTCQLEDDVCGARDLGLVQAVELPQLQNVSAPNLHAAWYPTTPCSVGVFVLRDVPVLPGGASVTTCPDGSPQIFGQCLTPQIGPATATGTAIGANCLNSVTNTSFLTPGGNDGRAWNRELRAAAGSLRNQRIAGQPNPVSISNAVYRMRSRNGGAQCRQDDSTTNIGCIVGNTTCALGVAGREATDNPSSPFAIAAPVGNVAPTVANIQSFAYPFARKVYINSIIGFDRIRAEVPAIPSQAEQEQLVRCIENEPAAHAAAIAAAGLLPLPAIESRFLVPGHLVQFREGPAIGTALSTSPGLSCEDVNEAVLCGSAGDAPNCQRL